MLSRIGLSVALLVLTAGLIGCGDSKDGKQPKISGTPDPKLQGAQPAPVGAQPGGKGGTPGAGID